MNRFSYARILFTTVMMLVAGTSSAKDLFFGQLASTTNPLVTEISKSMTQGYQLAFDRANEAGGVNGNKLRLITKDDQFKAEEGVRLVKEMIEKDGVIAFAGCIGTPVINALTKEKTLIAANIAYVGPFSGSSAALKSPNVFPVRATYESELERIFQLTQTMFQKRVAFFYFKAGIGPVMSTAAVDMASKYRVDLLSNAGFEVSPEPAKQKMAVDQAMAPFAKDRPDAVIMIAAGNAMWTALAHAREIYGQLVPIYSISIVTIEDIIKQIGIANAQGIIVSQAMPSPQGLERQMAREYLNDIKKFRKDMKPGYVTFEGYVGGRILAEALKLAGGNPTRESLLKALYGMGERNIGDIRVKYANGDRHGNDSVDVVVIGKGGIQVR